MNKKSNKKQAWFGVLLGVLAAAVVADLGVSFVLGLRVPGYSPWRDTISQLGAPGSPVQLLESVNLVIVGVLFLFFAVGELRLAEKPRRFHHWYAWGLILFAVGCVLAGIFPEDAAGSAESVSGKIHGISSGLGFLALMFNPLWMVWIHNNRGMRLLNGLFFGAAVVTFILFGASEDVSAGWLSYTGLFQRINLLVLYASLVVNFLVLYGRRQMVREG